MLRRSLHACVRAPARISFPVRHRRCHSWLAAAAVAGAALAAASQCDSELDDSEEATALAALGQSLRRLANWASLEPAWRQFRHARGGGDACALAYLRTGGNDPEAVAERIAHTLLFRQANGLVADDAELWRAVEEHPARDRWPFAYLPGSEVPDGSPVCYARLSQLQVAATLAAFDEEELMHFVALWFEGAQRLLGDSSRRRGDPVRGTYDVYDCADLSAWGFLSEVRAHRPAIKRIFAIGSEHFPDLLYKCYVLNAPTVAALVWRCVAPFMSEQAQAKVCISRGVPPELAEALGGEAAVRRMVALVSEEGKEGVA